MGECPDYPERQRFIPFIPGSLHPDTNISSKIIKEFEEIFHENEDEWIPPENYFLLKYSLKYIRNNQICFLVVAFKLEELCYAKVLTRQIGYFNSERCERQLNFLLDVTKEDEAIKKVSENGEYSLSVHIRSIIEDLLNEDKKFRQQFYADSENFRRVLKFFKGDYAEDEVDDIFEALGQYSLIIIDIEPEDAGLISKAIRYCSKKEIESIKDFNSYKTLVKTKINSIQNRLKINDTRMKADEQLLNLWENFQNQSDVIEWPKPPKPPELPRTTSLSPREHYVESPPSVLPPPPTMPPPDASLPQMIIPPQVAIEPMEIEIPTMDSPSAPTTPINKDLQNDLFDAKKYRGRPKKSLTLDIPQVPAKKSKMSSRESSETPKPIPVEKTPENERSPVLAKNSSITTSKIITSASTPDLSHQSRVKSTRSNADMPIREARKRPQTFYTPTNSPRALTPSRGSEDRNLDVIPQELLTKITSKQSSSIPQSAKSSASQSARSSEERKSDVRSRKNTPLLRGDTKKISYATVETQTFIQIPHKLEETPKTSDNTTEFLKFYNKKQECNEDGEKRTVCTQTGPLSIPPEMKLMRWFDPTLKTNFLAKQIIKACYGPASRYIRDKTCTVTFKVERRSVIDLPNPLRSHKNYDRVQKISKLGLNEVYTVPARFTQPKYRRIISKPMDQQTIKELMTQGQVKSSLELTLNAVLMCANNVVFNVVKANLTGTKSAEQNTLNVIDILRNPKE